MAHLEPEIAFVQFRVFSFGSLVLGQEKVVRRRDIPDTESMK